VRKSDVYTCVGAKRGARSAPYKRRADSRGRVSSETPPSAFHLANASRRDSKGLLLTNDETFDKRFSVRLKLRHSNVPRCVNYRDMTWFAPTKRTKSSLCNFIGPRSCDRLESVARSRDAPRFTTLPVNTNLSTLLHRAIYRSVSVGMRFQDRIFSPQRGRGHSSRSRAIRGALESGSHSNLSIVRQWLLEIKRHCLRVNSS